MRIISELVGGIVLLLIFAYGVVKTIDFFSTKERQDGNIGTTLRGPGAGEESSDAGEKPH